MVFINGYMKDISKIMKQIDDALTKAKPVAGSSLNIGLNDRSEQVKITEANQLMISVIERLTYGSQNIYKKSVNDLLKKHGIDNPYSTTNLMGILQALRTDYNDGHFETITELIHADVFSDFLEMAKYLLDSKYKDPAAVLVGGVLEEHLRKLCLKNNIDIYKQNKEPKKTDSLNAELYKLEVYGGLDNKNIIAWLELRNNAAHGKYDAYRCEQVDLMLKGVSIFISNNPA